VAKKKILTPEERKAKREKRAASYDPIMDARNALRRAFSRSPIVVEMMNDHNTKRHVPQFKKDGTRCKIDAVEHLCAVCGEWKRSTKKSKVAIDHIVPVIDPQVGFVDLNTYHKRLWCSRDNLQKICGEDHRLKTNAERQEKQLREDAMLLIALENVHDQAILRKSLKRFTAKRLREIPYPPGFRIALSRLKDRLA
jgi:hypothetical protein